MTNKQQLPEDPELHMDDHFHARHAHKYVGAYLFVVILLLVVGAVYAWQHKKLEHETAQVRTLQIQLEAAQHDYHEAMAGAPKR